MGPINKEDVAECVGLWLAEGSTTSNSEITFTNTCLELVDHFYKTVSILFKDYNYRPRIYIYSKDGSRPYISYKGCVIKYYIHKRATKPFLIFRIASVNMVKEWRTLVNDFLKIKELYPFILRGFFAGEGNVHTGKRSVRILRISQGVQKPFIDKILRYLEIKFSFETRNRNYILSGKSNWDIFAKLKLADLHPNKKEKFWRNYETFKEDHYAKNYLANTIESLLEKPMTAAQLSLQLKRSPARVSEVLVQLKKEKKVRNFRIRSIDYWTKKSDLILLSGLKLNYLYLLEKKKKTSEVADYFSVNWKSAFDRLNELRKLDLVERNRDGTWMRISTTKELLKC